MADTSHKSQTPSLRKTLTLSLIMAVIWWIAAMLIRQLDVLHVWTDQQDKFTLAASNFFDPYRGMSGFFSPPWAVIPLVPFEFMPLPLATLLQALTYFGLLGWIAHRYGIRLIGLVAAMLSPLALDAVLELNIDWIAAIGLVVPPVWSPIFLAVKPQSFTGYIFTLTWQQIVRATSIMLGAILLSFLIWGVDWLEGLTLEFSTRSLALNASISLWGFMPILSILLGVALLAYAFYRQDDVLKILSGVFFAPYLPTYTAIIPFLFLCIRYPRFGFYVSIGLWLITATILGPVL
ncbi:MAG: hypothetical protein Q9P01_09470 [Anaerolineae bacterium]|nr:hypothetical protein [Anaerolineae bacterium]MDQ7035046.1 hypothetical protein [Anaerolineae bacterium]